MDPLSSGLVSSIRGSVVDVKFNSRLPLIHTLLLAGKNQEIILEVQAHLDAHHVRGIALSPTEGLSRGMEVKNTNEPLKAPVGKTTLSRMFDVFGKPIDRQPEPENVEWRSVHQPPPPLQRRSTKSEIFETGIKAIDVLMPLERGGKAGFLAVPGWAKRFYSPK